LLETIERLLLHFKVRFDLLVSGQGAFVSEPQRDGCDVHTRLKQMPGGGVAT
jgi:hypothetical protein